MIWYKALFSFDGRLNRQGFWIGVAINFAFLFIMANFVLDLTAFSWFSLVPLAVSAFSLAAVIVKRLHDRNRSGKAVLMVFVPILCYGASLSAQGTMAWLLGIAMPMFIGTMLLLEWGGFKGMNEPNRFGDQGLSLKLK